MAVVVIVDPVRIKGCEEWREGHMHEMNRNIRANTPSPLLPQSSVQIKGGVFLGAYGTSKPKKFVYNCLQLYNNYHRN